MVLAEVGLAPGTLAGLPLQRPISSSHAARRHSQTIGSDRTSPPCPRLRRARYEYWIEDVGGEQPRRPPARQREHQRGAGAPARGAAERLRPRARLGCRATPHVQPRARALRDGESRRGRGARRGEFDSAESRLRDLAPQCGRGPGARRPRPRGPRRASRLINRSCARSSRM